MKWNWSAWVPSHKWLVIPPILLGIVAVVYFAAQRKPLPRTDQTETAIVLPIEVVQPTSLVPQSTGFGTARAVRSWTAIAEVRGEVVRVSPSLESGNWVGKNDFLFQIDRQDYQLRLDQRASDLAAARAKVQELEASEVADRKSLAIEEDLLKLAQSDVQRFERLRGSNAVSPSDVDQMKSALLRQSQSVQKLKNTITLYPSRIASAKAAERMAELSMQEAQRDLERTTVKAPFAGSLAGVTVEAGQIVAAGQGLFQILDTRTIEVDAQFSLSQLRRVLPVAAKTDSRASSPSLAEGITQLEAVAISRSGDLQEDFPAVPIRISDSLNQQTRTLGVVVSIDNGTPKSIEMADGKQAASRDSTASDSAPGLRGQSEIRPGTFCEVVLRGVAIKNVISVPQCSIDGDAVYIVNSDNRLQRRVIKLGAGFGDRYQVLEGLRAGERLVVKPPVPAIEGVLVDVNDSLTPVAERQTKMTPAEFNRSVELDRGERQ